MDVHELRLHVEEETVSLLYLTLRRINLTMMSILNLGNQGKYFDGCSHCSPFESRPRSRRREAKQRMRSSEEDSRSNSNRNDKNSETRSDSSLDIASIEELNEKRLRRLAELNASNKVKAMPETDIIDSFLKRESLKNLIPSTESKFQPIY